MGGRLDGFLHAIAFAPRTRRRQLPAHAVGERRDRDPHERVLSEELAVGMPLMERDGGAIVSPTDATVAWPIYDWMGVAKAASSPSPATRAHLGLEAASG